jgi:hypothetical protein
LLIESNYNYGDIEKAKELLRRLKMRIPSSMTVEYYVKPEICQELLPQQDTNDYIEERIN